MDRFVSVAPTPSYLPHQGGGFSPLMGHDLAMTTERHLPLDGGGWEGVGQHGATSTDRYLRA
jgi:hypothetical protein